jgi:hypothetical protein
MYRVPAFALVQDTSSDLSYPARQSPDPIAADARN